MPFELAHLQELVVEHENTSVLRVLDDVTLPSLERLQVVTPSKDIVPIFTKMFQRSGCTLTHLTVRDPTSIDTVVSLLRLCGSLRELSLLRIALPIEDVLTFLLERNGGSCPSLRVLVMDVSYASEVDRDVLLIFIDRFFDILELRCSNNANNAKPLTSSLESATLYAPRESMLPFTPSQEERIKELRRTGLELYVYRYAPDEPRVY
ncbi:hypothetical protein CPB85DRAFT_1442978 [Mucidula mucida]|nr:hypothetical protein CPB85DRAFT_1442978 [Mucidula mucida]